MRDLAVEGPADLGPELEAQVTACCQAPSVGGLPWDKAAFGSLAFGDLIKAGVAAFVAAALWRAYPLAVAPDVVLGPVRHARRTPDRIAIRLCRR
jgi:hypothetical protein